MAIFACSMLVLRAVAAGGARQRLGRFAEGRAAPAQRRAGRLAALAKLARPLVRLSIPDQGWEKTALPKQFLNAGLRNPHAPAMYFAAKTMLAIVAPSLLWLILLKAAPEMRGSAAIFCLLGAAAAGFYLPNIALARAGKAYQRKIFEQFPDSLDLLIVCLEAGLALDAAIGRVARELASSAPEVSDELHLVTLELRAGSSREKALRNLATRTGVDGIDTLVAMLIQAERFGTSTAESLRAYADELRTKRRQLAEETAAKVALKLLFPLIFCIFPALLLVLLGPAMIQIYRAFLPALPG
ncbi:type II secretion system F family protein [Massilia sp. R2A-15]|uniref:type II secretion system F family protein n=1 Tax=Massilia sp. R2A-15 TaxID=3064278 RepID=UPI0027343327|nr:type II secretion system F family protein [Massilia sp. R2A-15]WLI87754.1 type II secretion system F family protein [Massilia sp. R2A-15]